MSYLLPFKVKEQHIKTMHGLKLIPQDLIDDFITRESFTHFPHAYNVLIKKMKQRGINTDKYLNEKKTIK